jgi:hypothetical protein
MTAATPDQVLQDAAHRQIVRVGDTVRRPLHPWSPTIHHLLSHLEDVGFEHAPRFLGIDAEGREVLTFLGGESGPNGWAKVVNENSLTAMAHLLRDYHRAVAGFVPDDAMWAAASGPPAAGEVVCHGDFGPWNLVWSGTRPVGIIDWDYAWPAPPLHDVAYALEYVAPFRDDEEAIKWLRYPAPPARRRRIEIFATAYGLTDLDGLVDAVLDQQQLVLARVRRLAAEGHEPQVTWQANGDIEREAERVRWAAEHRHLFS